VDAFELSAGPPDPQLVDPAASGIWATTSLAG